LLKGQFFIKQNSRGYIVIRRGGEYKQHAHVKKLQTCNLLIDLIAKNKLPDSQYLRGSCKRLLTEEEYSLLRPRKQMYYNSQKGVRRR
jgi:hypothetical protein